MSGYDGEKRFVVAETRRRWSASEREAIVEETLDAPVSSVARKHGVAASLLFRWRRDAGLAAKKKPEATDRFLPVVTQGAAVASSSARGDDAACMIEIELRGGHRLKIRGAVGVQALKQVIAALGGG